MVHLVVISNQKETIEYLNSLYKKLSSTPTTLPLTFHKLMPVSKENKPTKTPLKPIPKKIPNETIENFMLDFSEALFRTNIKQVNYVENNATMNHSNV